MTRVLLADMCAWCWLLFTAMMMIEITTHKRKESETMSDFPMTRWLCMILVVVGAVASLLWLWQTVKAAV